MKVRSALLGTLVWAHVAWAIPLVAVEPPAVSPGGVVLVRVGSPFVAGSFRGEPLRFFPVAGGQAALLGIDLDVEPGRFDVALSFPGNDRKTVDIRVVPKTYPEERLRVSRRFTELSPEALERVSRERDRLEALWRTASETRLWTNPFVMPAKGPRGSPFGLRRFFNDEPRSPHAGIDVKAPQGAPVTASNRGRVVLVDDLFFTGKTVVLDHGLGLYTIYVHLSETRVRESEMIERGQRLGSVGATGRVTGPHLHFGVRLGGARVDPMALLHLDLEASAEGDT